ADEQLGLAALHIDDVQLAALRREVARAVEAIAQARDVAYGGHLVALFADLLLRLALLDVGVDRADHAGDLAAVGAPGEIDHAAVEGRQLPALAPVAVDQVHLAALAAVAHERD